MQPIAQENHTVTEYLQQWRSGCSESLAKVIDLTYEELRCLAVAHFNRAQPGDTLCPTALLNEAFPVDEETTQHGFPQPETVFLVF